MALEGLELVFHIGGLSFIYLTLGVIIAELMVSDTFGNHDSPEWELMVLFYPLILPGIVVVVALRIVRELADSGKQNMNNEGEKND